MLLSNEDLGKPQKCIALFGFRKMWNQRESPFRVEKRFEFEEYQNISRFMKMVDELCKETNIYPNISFGKNFVSITVFLASEKISKIEKDFSNQIDNYFVEI